ncbi:MAG: hypothetical protein NVV82_00445 [Sporocytophaga sp.]|nr:hypothetical protein [Sporocytophaga sp.]
MFNIKRYFSSYLRWTFIFLFQIAIFYSNSAQDIASIGTEKNPLKISGSLSANQIFYTVKGIDSRRQPYNYFLNGNVNFSLYGWNVPVSFSYSNQQAAFRQPFNQYGIQPTYKWVRGYIGYNSMVFSPYTLNGHVFLGGGVELTPPGIFRLSAMYGRFQKPVKEDTSNTSIIPSYQRMGGGIKVGVGKDGNFIDLIIFKAQDYLSSLDTVPQKKRCIAIRKYGCRPCCEQEIRGKNHIRFRICFKCLHKR